MKPARILLLAVAVIAGGLAAFLVSRGAAPEPETTQAVAQVRQEPKTRVLVASVNIGMGQRLTDALVEWQDWPEGAVRPEYITYDVVPDAPEQMVGTVARFEIFAGEPIRQAKLVRTSQGYLSAVIAKGMRAVSVGVSAVSGAGGFIVPNDRVDVVSTRRGASNSATRTILANVRVLAIGQRLGEVGAPSGNPDPEDPQSQMFADQTIATLELNPIQSEIIIGAAADGELSLVLRSVADFAPGSDDELPQNNSQPIRLVRFGAASNVIAGAPEKLAAISASNSSSGGSGVVVPIFSAGGGPSSQTQPSAAPNSAPEVALQ